MKWITLLLSVAALSAASESSAEKDVLNAMDAWKRATIGKDRAALERLLADDLTYTHSTGKMQNKSEVLESVMSGKPSSVETIDFSNTKVRVHGNTALVEGTVDIRNNADGKSSTALLDILHVWIKGPHGWQMAARHALRLPQQ